MKVDYIRFWSTPSIITTRYKINITSTVTTLILKATQNDINKVPRSCVSKTQYQSSDVGDLLIGKLSYQSSTNTITFYHMRFNMKDRNVLYFGATPNQQIDVGIEYALKNMSKRILLIGSDYIFPKVVNLRIKKYVKHNNATLLDEVYVDLDQKDFDKIAKNIVSKHFKERIVIINTLNGDSNKYFFEAMYKYFELMPTHKYNVFFID